MQETTTTNGVRIDNGVAVADLLDLESELHNIEQGYNQLQNIPAFAEDSWPSNDIFAGVQPTAAALHSVSSGTAVAPFPPPPVSSFALKNPALLPDPFDDSFNPRSTVAAPATAMVPPAPAITAPVNAFNVHQHQQQQQQQQQNASFSTTTPSLAAAATVWPQQPDAFAPASTTSTGPIAFSVTNPFVSTVQEATVARMEPDPFDTGRAQRVLKDSASYHFSTAVPSWPANENTVPSLGADPSWSLPKAFNKLVDMDALVSAPEMKKNPFSELINPSKKASINSAATAMTVSSSTATTVIGGSTVLPPPRAPFIPARTPAPLIVSTTANNDPFNDEFFH
ncbi:unnamed protein product [Gongylonema pulchrum]|uniref:Uncharacterized protein n=1 Tax=Gongylonema pulchrum TaxID=637853 RepID=A0A3P6PQG5_9BILA|nr:unnamed protein product [Gongylonema pulchrum]